MALKKNPEMEAKNHESEVVIRTKEIFNRKDSSKKETKILTTFSIEPSFKKDLEDLFADMGLGWAAGIRFALKEFSKKYKEEN